MDERFKIDIIIVIKILALKIKKKFVVYFDKLKTKSCYKKI